MYTYSDILTLKGTGVLNVTGTVHDAELRRLLESASQEIDRSLNRNIHPVVGTFEFSGDGGTLLNLRDLVSVSTLLEDTNNDGTFETGWAVADYFLGPYNAEPTLDFGRPYQWLQVSSKTTGTQDEFLRGQQNYRIAGTWGYQSVTLTLGLTVSSSLSATATSIVLSGSASGTIEAGMTMLVGTEQLYVLTGGGATGTAVTVRRGVNGATSAVIASGSAIALFTYPPAIQQAVLIQAGRMFKRAQAAFASQAAPLDVGVFQPFAGMDRDVQQLLAQYRRPAIGVGF